MKISASHVGGNIVFRGIEGDRVYLAPDMRDTDNWFYWNFCVEGAQGRTLTFDFAPARWVGYHGAAVSRDYENWDWTYTASDDGSSFTYTFGPDEDKVYFCHDMYYSLERFEKFTKRVGVDTAPFTRTRKGRETPCATVGEGDKWILLTSRHHSCESTGTYVMEGMMERQLAHPIKGYRLMCVPFIDLDGVVDGDQGKDRHPHDHNRDYCTVEQGGEIYPETVAVKKFIAEHDVKYVFDLHSPWHLGGNNDTLFNVGCGVENTPRMQLFSRCLQKTAAENPTGLKYDGSGDIKAGEGWNVMNDDGVIRSCSRYASVQEGMIYAESFETTYFGTHENVVNQKKLVAFGHSLLEAIRLFMEEEGVHEENNEQ